MSFQITYRRLFTVEIDHGYRLNEGDRVFESFNAEDQTRRLRTYNIHDDLVISPTPETLRAFAQRKMVFRTTPRGFFVGVELSETTLLNEALEKPAIPFDEPLVFAFSVHLKNAQFFNITNLRMRNQGNQLYYFSNQAKNDKEDQRFLSVPVAAFDADEPYQSGDLRVDDSDNPTELFEAIRKIDGTGSPLNADDWRPVSPAPSHEARNYQKGEAAVLGGTLYIANKDTGSTPPGGDWDEIPFAHQYVTFLDRIVHRPARFDIPVTTAASTATLELYKPGSTEPVFKQVETVEPNITTFKANLPTVAPGQYVFELKEGDTTKGAGGPVIDTTISNLFYLDQSLYESRAFGVIEIMHDPAVGPDAVRLLNDDDTVFDPKLVYNIRFRHRSTFWRYIFNSDQDPAKITLTPDPLVVGADEVRRFKTDDMQPLTRASIQIKKFKDPMEDGEDLLPNPEPSTIKLQKPTEEIFSEIYLP